MTTGIEGGLQWSQERIKELEAERDALAETVNRFVRWADVLVMDLAVPPIIKAEAVRMRDEALSVKDISDDHRDS